MTACFEFGDAMSVKGVAAEQGKDCYITVYSGGQHVMTLKGVEMIAHFLVNFSIVGDCIATGLDMGIIGSSERNLPEGD